MEHVELVDRIYLKVKSMIFDQELKPGQKLLQEKLAEELGVSRSPLLKALQKLENELLVESIPRRGLYVKTMSVQDVIDVFQCRAVVEGLSARLTASVITEKQIQTLKNMFSQHSKRKNINVVEYAKTDREFHACISNWSGNSVITKMEVLSNNQLKAFQAGLLRPPHETIQEHIAIIDALEQRNGLLAERLMRAHVTESLNVFQKTSVDA